LQTIRELAAETRRQFTTRVPGLYAHGSDLPGDRLLAQLEQQREQICQLAGKIRGRLARQRARLRKSEARAIKRTADLDRRPEQLAVLKAAERSEQEIIQNLISGLTGDGNE
jgi:hypothetical protein